MAKNRRFKPLILWVAAACVLLIIAGLSSLPLLIQSDYLEQLITQTVEKQLRYHSSFQHLRLSFLPTPALHLDRLELQPIEQDSSAPLIVSEEAVFRPSIFSILFGKPELAYVLLRNADLHYTWRDPNSTLVKTVSLRGASVELWNVRENKPVRFKIRGKFLSDSENVNWSGKFQAASKDFQLKTLVLKTQASIDALELSRLAAWWGGELPIRFQSGTLSFSGQLNKDARTTKLEIDIASKIQNLVYQIISRAGTSQAGDYEARLHADLDLADGSLSVSEGSLTAPFGGPFDLETKFNLKSGSIAELLVKTEALHIEMLPQYILSVEEVLPVNLGFSGESQLDFFLKGDPALLLINWRMNLTQVTLSYSKYFSKPTGVPLVLAADMKLAGGRVLRGSFSVDFEQAALKGSLVNLDLKTGDSEFTVLTNKFGIEGWQAYFPPIQAFTLSGAVKILASLKGNLNRLNQAEIMSNVSLDHLQAEAANGAQVKDLNGSVDFGPMDSEIKNVRFELGDTSFSIEGKMLRQPDPRWLVGIQTPKLPVRDFISQLHKIFEAVQWEGPPVDWRAIESAAAGLFSSQEALEQLSTRIAMEAGRVVIPNLSFGVFNGDVSVRAALNYANPAPVTTMEFEFNRLSLARLQANQTKPLVEGNFFAVGSLSCQGPFDSEWPGRLKGRGSISVTNGEFHTLDLLGSLGEIAQLAPLGRFKSGTTRFNDVRGDFQVGDRKIGTQNTLLVSDDFQVEGAGDLGFDGNLNLRLSVYLAPSLSQKISSHLGENMRLGPIPILIVGPIASPSIRKDPMLIQTFLESLVQQQFSKISAKLMPSGRRENSQMPTAEEQVSDRAKTQTETSKAKSLEQSLVESGFGLLDQFLSKNKSASS
ncbi:MAG: DUF748 domain-containing protein [Candidatus Omnitrophica bacterium]|nr:DUF748 domain-containing protein [Candidatus Omnitrophota bacterium]